MKNNLDKLLKHLEEVTSNLTFSNEDVRRAMMDVLLWLNEPENNTDENCRRIDAFVSTQINDQDIERLPESIQSILFDMGGALHDTHTSPEVAENFSSTPRQLLERARRL